MTNIDKKFLVFEPIVFVERQFKKANRRKKLSKTIFMSLNVVAALAGFAVLVLTNIIISKIISDSIPAWYFYSTTVVTAVTTLLTSLVNFFYVKDKMVKYEDQSRVIQSEIIKFKLNTPTYKEAKNPTFLLYKNVAVATNTPLAKEGEDDEEK